MCNFEWWIKKEQCGAPKGENSADYGKTLEGPYTSLRECCHCADLGEQLDREKKSLLHWATTHQCLYSSRQLEDFLHHFEELGEGNGQ